MAFLKNNYIPNFEAECGCNVDDEFNDAITKDYDCPDANSFPLCYPIQALADIQIVQAYSYEPTSCQTISFEDFPEYVYTDPFCQATEPFGLPCGIEMPQINNLDACTL